MGKGSVNARRVAAAEDKRENKPTKVSSPQQETFEMIFSSIFHFLSLSLSHTDAHARTHSHTHTHVQTHSLSLSLFSHGEG